MTRHDPCVSACQAGVQELVGIRRPTMCGRFGARRSRLFLKFRDSGQCLR
ncbi:hypothetical protein CSUI_010643 [Cystoisospora suis]|uniref:Uncharacterized protein n=1 Tax=Cystoisospora suis TaxID=483139 RepID=A0A2C6KG73_9APIC|nr:hypothetical protein CSUI_010643 [Cystoisospora suis]